MAADEGYDVKGQSPRTVLPRLHIALSGENLTESKNGRAAGAGSPPASDRCLAPAGNAGEKCRPAIR